MSDSSLLVVSENSASSLAIPIVVVVNISLLSIVFINLMVLISPVLLNICVAFLILLYL